MRKYPLKKGAIIFDMDGVIIDSERLWQEAEREVFTSLGVQMDKESCKQTQSMTTNEVTDFWYSKYPWTDQPLHEVEQKVINCVIDLIEAEHCEIPGAKGFLKKLKSHDFKIGLATNSPYKIVPRVLSKLELTHYFDVIVSAEFVKQGKPAPDVYLTACERLEEKAANCFVIEDSNSGIIAGKKAGMNVIAFTNNGKNNLTGFDHIIHTYDDIDWNLFNEN